MRASFSLVFVQLCTFNVIYGTHSFVQCTNISYYYTCTYRTRTHRQYKLRIGLERDRVCNVAQNQTDLKSIHTFWVRNNISHTLPKHHSEFTCCGCVCMRVCALWLALRLYWEDNEWQREKVAAESNNNIKNRFGWKFMRDVYKMCVFRRDHFS